MLHPPSWTWSAPGGPPVTSQQIDQDVGHHIVPTGAGPLALPVLPWLHTRSGVCLNRYSEGFFIHRKLKKKKEKRSESRRGSGKKNLTTAEVFLNRTIFKNCSTQEFLNILPER